MFKLSNLTFLFYIVLEILVKSTSSLYEKRDSPVCPRDFNYHASIRVEYDKLWIHHCSGAVLDDDHVITTASCIHGLSPADIKIVVGTLLYDPVYALDPWHPLNDVAHGYIHKRFNSSLCDQLRTVDYDVAIIKTEQSLQPHGSYSAVSPAFPNINILDGQHATMSLWKNVVIDGNAFNKLHQKAGMKTNDKRCNCSYSNCVSSQMFCFEFDDGCYGEIGAPLVTYSDGSLVLIGIYSWSGDCTNVAFPAVFTRISKFYYWIQDVVTYFPSQRPCGRH